MPGIIDPVGPEEPRTYWIRRAVVGGVILVILIAVIVLATSLFGGDKGTTAAPPSGASGPTLRPATTDEPSPSTSAPSGSTGASGSTGPSTSASGSGSSSTSTKPSAGTTSSTKADPSPKTAPSSSKPPPEPKPCNPKDLRTTLTGPRTVTPEKKVTFRAGVINGGTTTCTFTVDPQTYTFRIYSGTDKIWTTGDCTKWLPKVNSTLKPQQDVTWTISWTVQRSKDCSLVDTKLRPGTYAANSLVDGAKAAQVVMQLK